MGGRDAVLQVSWLRYAMYELSVGDAAPRFWRVRVKSSVIEREELSLTEVRACSIHAFAESNGSYLAYLSSQLIEAYALGNPF